jgi:hypothetical protein
MSIAHNVILKIRSKPLDAFSFGAGYGVVQSTGERVFYPVGSLEQERRNDSGRTTYCRYRYADNSCLEYRYSELHGYKMSSFMAGGG